MKGLRIIPAFVLLIILSFLGALFVVQNNDPVTIRFLHNELPPTRLGLVILCSILLGMLISALFCTIELLSLYVQNRRLKRKLSQFRTQVAESVGSFEGKMEPNDQSSPSAHSL